MHPDCFGLTVLKRTCASFIDLQDSAVPRSRLTATKCCRSGSKLKLGNRTGTIGDIKSVPTNKAAQFHPLPRRGQDDSPGACCTARHLAESSTPNPLSSKAIGTAFGPLSGLQPLLRLQRALARTSFSTRRRRRASRPKVAKAP